MRFDEEMTEHQVEWRKANLSPGEKGWQNRRQYEWILPKEDWKQGLWKDIQSPMSEYLSRTGVQKHAGVHNLKSSWMVCANLYFPFRGSEEGRALLAGFLRKLVHPEITSVDAVELEYAEEGKLHPSELLGEQGGIRGSGQTSPDIAFLVNGRRGLILTENKFVEHSFYRCSARRLTSSKERAGNPDPSRCLNPLKVLQNQESECHQATWGRKYWGVLAPVIDPGKLASLHCCPAAVAGYQLFRQQALAEGIAASGTYDFVVSCLAIDERNTGLRSCLASTGIRDIAHWGVLFNGKTRFALFTHQDWVAWVRSSNPSSQWRDWLDYVEKRYGFAA